MPRHVQHLCIWRCAHASLFHGWASPRSWWRAKHPSLRVATLVGQVLGADVSVRGLPLTARTSASAPRTRSSHQTHGRRRRPLRTACHARLRHSPRPGPTRFGLRSHPQRRNRSHRRCPMSAAPGSTRRAKRRRSPSPWSPCPPRRGPASCRRPRCRRSARWKRGRRWRSTPRTGPGAALPASSGPQVAAEELGLPAAQSSGLRAASTGPWSAPAQSASTTRCCAACR
mmetsp:Transcript_71171/g.224834  ORF Transcript_71171/g.224834 Transcript_71171/m.224834 type:complete len:228 (+) Transcript_71171:3-686(+)